MKFINKQALNKTLSAGSTDYIPTADNQIRAFTVFNPTTANVELSVTIGGKVYVKKTVTPNATEVINTLFNQQLAKDEKCTLAGEGLNVLLTVVEIVE